MSSKDNAILGWLHGIITIIDPHYLSAVRTTPLTAFDILETIRDFALKANEPPNNLVTSQKPPWTSSQPSGPVDNGLIESQQTSLQLLSASQALADQLRQLVQDNTGNIQGLEKIRHDMETFTKALGDYQRDDHRRLTAALPKTLTKFNAFLASEVSAVLSELEQKRVQLAELNKQISNVTSQLDNQKKSHVVADLRQIDDNIALSYPKAPAGPAWLAAVTTPRGIQAATPGPPVNESLGLDPSAVEITSKPSKPLSGWRPASVVEKKVPRYQVPAADIDDHKDTMVAQRVPKWTTWHQALASPADRDNDTTLEGPVIWHREFKSCDPPSYVLDSSGFSGLIWTEISSAGS
ncbi:hypothetical protein C8J56DRAFT_1066589 [Mycena floridula]|nr:hypothetical protein C8J56DRAFT_1066589 [Mycena floridula]